MTRRGKRPLSDEEKELWRRVAKTVEPLEHALEEELLEPVVIEEKPTTKSPPVTVKSPAAPKVSKTRDTPLSIGNYAGIDRRTADRFRKGKYEIDATLDLHGHNREKAFSALSDFIVNESRRGSRGLLVITGKGKGADTPGILREMLPHWLQQAPWRSLVLAFDKAKPQHGGSGAYYILLKRMR